MFVSMVECPDGGHEYRSLIVEETRDPPVWSCSACGGRNTSPQGAADGDGHPWADGCMGSCCG